MVDKPSAHDGDRLEAAVGVLWESGVAVPVIHVPAILSCEVHPDVSPAQVLAIRSHILVSFGEVIEVVDAEQEGVQGLPGTNSQGKCCQDQFFTHFATSRAYRRQFGSLASR